MDIPWVALARSQKTPLALGFTKRRALRVSCTLAGFTLAGHQGIVLGAFQKWHCWFIQDVMQQDLVARCAAFALYMLSHLRSHLIV